MIEGLDKALEIIAAMRQSEAYIFGEPKFSGQRGEDRSVALHDAYQAIYEHRKKWTNDHKMPSQNS